MTAADWACLSLLAILNLSVAYVYWTTLRAVSIKDVVAEKSQDVAVGAQNESSSSRVIGFIGGMIMACFVWAVANTLIYLGVYKPELVTGFIGSIGGFLLSGSALFLPYAVNRLTDVGKAAMQGSDKPKDEVAKKVGEQKTKIDEATKDAAQKIDAAIGQQALTAEQAKGIVADAIKKATGG